jgi:nitrite reductase/ring-hydroxylating ferredoxin subunit
MKLQSEVRADAIIKDGQYYILDSFVSKNETYAAIENLIFQGIEDIAGVQCRKAVENSGLRKMHEHFPVDSEFQLYKYLQTKASNLIIKLTHDVAREELGIEGEFYIDKDVPIRIHYPLAIARKSKFSFEKSIVYGQSPLRTIINKVKTRLSAQKTASIKLNKAYHKNLPQPAWSHGPHKDTWFGHSYDGINLWWSITGVNEHSGLVLYPGTFGVDMAYEHEPPYVAAGVPLPKPVKISLQDGSLLLFNPEMLHSTHVNTSDETRIVVSPRLNPKAPTFSEVESMHADRKYFWISSLDVEKGIFDNAVVFPRDEYMGEPKLLKDTAKLTKPLSIKVKQPLKRDVSIDVGESSLLKVGDKMLVEFSNNVEVIVVRNAKGLQALAARCPHVGINLIDGYHDDNAIFCPGHGLKFDLETGKSSCNAFSSRHYNVFEKSDRIFVGM